MHVDYLTDAYQKSYGNSRWAGAFAEGKERDLYVRFGNAIRGVLWEDTQSLKNQAAYERLRKEQEHSKE